MTLHQVTKVIYREMRYSGVVFSCSDIQTIFLKVIEKKVSSSSSSTLSGKSN